MNRIIFSALLLSGLTANAQQQQVGINTAEPKATLHVEAGASENKGVIIPRITAAEMKTMTAGLGADHHSMMTYLKEDLPSADQTGKLAEVKEAGYYFYNHTAAKWEKIGTSGEQDLRYINTNHITKDAGVGGNGSSVGMGVHNIGLGAGVLQSNTLGHQNIAIGSGSLGLNTTGGQNVAHGFAALGFNTTGSNNIAIGSGALQGQSATIPTTGHFNIALGTDALKNNSTGENNIAQGYRALHYNTTGKNNIAIGESALQGQFSTTITGNYNIALGANALQNTTSGDYNIAQGKDALNRNTEGYSNIAQGGFALSYNTTGHNNIAQGNQALYSNTTGYFNIAQGTQALLSNTTGYNNIAQGTQALYSNTEGRSNIAQGSGALFNNTEGSFNIAIGEEALQGPAGTPTTGNYNIAVGIRALSYNTTGEHNIALGQEALKSNTAGRNNIAQGQNALNANTFGGHNIAQGQNALYNNTSGSENIAIGPSVLRNNSTGNNNLGIGTSALPMNSTGSNNFALGQGALAENSTGDYNTGIGHYAGQWIKGNGNMHIGIDSDAYKSMPTVSGQLNKVIFIGHFDSLNDTFDTSNASSNVILLGDDSSNAPNVGIGTYRPAAKLDIKGPYGGAIRIADGTEGQGKVLTSDYRGVGTWKGITFFTGTERIGAYHWGSGTALGNTNFNKIASITVPPGASMVYVKIHLLAGGLTSGAARAYVGKKDIGWNNSNTNDTPIGGSALFVTYHGIDPELQTSFIYNNTTNSNETLYLNLQSNEPTVARSGFEYPTGGSYLGTNWVENQFSAIPIN